jgi:hypothetical protein
MEEQQKTEKEQIEEIISKFIEDKQKDKDVYFRGAYGELFEEEEKHTDYQHEIFTKIVFQVLSLNEKGQSYKIPKLVEKNYYIPLPAKEDFDKFIELFDKHLQEALTSASKEVLKTDKV